MKQAVSKVGPVFFLPMKTQYENLGDLVINRECIRLLRRHGRIVAGVAKAPAAFVEGLQLGTGEACRSALRFHLALIATGLRGQGRAYKVLLPGGFSGDLSGSRPFKEALTTAYFWFLRGCGVRIVRMGASVGPFSPARAWFEKRKSRAMRCLGLRDHLSIAYADAIRLANVRRFPDFAFMLATRERAAETSDPYIVLSFRADDASQLEAIAVGVRAMLERIDPDRRHAIVLAAQVERDERICAALRDLVADGRPTRIVDANIGEAGLFDLYHRAAWVISNRLHVLLFAASCAARIWALVDRRRNAKIIGLFEDAGFGDRLVHLDEPAAPARLHPDDPGLDLAVFARNRDEIEHALQDIVAPSAPALTGTRP